MRKMFSIIIIAVLINVAACSGEQTINGSNDRSAARSLAMIKRTLPSDLRLEFEIAYWTIRASLNKNKDFLATVNGKNVSEIIALGKKYFNNNLAAGIPAYTKYASWDDMLVKVEAERESGRIPEKPQSEVDKANNVLYRPGER